MDVTPSPQMYRAINSLIDAAFGGAPSPKDMSSSACERRVKRSHMSEILHGLVALSMREGVNRAIREAKERQTGPQDMEDRNAMSQAKDDAQAGKSRIVLPH